MTENKIVNVYGAGLAGCEAAWQTLRAVRRGGAWQRCTAQT